MLAHHCARGSLTEAVLATYSELRGHYAFVAMSADAFQSQSWRT